MSQLETLPSSDEIMGAILTMARNRGKPNASFKRFNALALAATKRSLLRGLISDFPPGQLQTKDFMLELFLDHKNSREDVELGIKARAGRGAILLAKKTKQEYILGKGVIAIPQDKEGKPLVTPPTMRGQLEHLLDVSGPDSPVSIRLATDHMAGRSPGNVEYIYPEGQDGPVHVFLDSSAGMLELGPDGATDMVALWERAEPYALSAEQSRIVMDKARQALENL